jgi:hypothetical protein
MYLGVVGERVYLGCTVGGRKVPSQYVSWGQMGRGVPGQYLELGT